MRYLVVNADDFGACPGVNRGIVTSASLMVAMPGSEEAAGLARECPALSVGLHVALHKEPQPVVALSDPGACRAALEDQLSRFRELLGRQPTHLDSHQHVHLREPVRSVLIECAAELAVPLRHNDPRIRYNGDFYGQTDEGRLLPEAISVDALIDILAALPSGATELACHPGLDDELQSTYRSERVQELKVLCDPRVRATLAAEEIELSSFTSVALQRLDPAS